MSGTVRSSEILGAWSELSLAAVSREEVDILPRPFN